MANSQAASKSWREKLRLLVIEGGPGQCIFPINNVCNAACDFCNFSRETLPRSDWQFVPLDGARRACEVLYRNDIHYLVITGGEPLMHPDVFSIVEHAHSVGLTVHLVTNASLLTPETCHRLRKSGMSSVFISVDAHNASVHEQNRGLPRVCERIRKANAELRQLGVLSTASVTVSRLITDYQALGTFLQNLGFDAVTFSYPLRHLQSSFLGYADSQLLQFSDEELHEAFESIKELKRSFTVVNPVASIEDMQRFIRGEPQRFGCLGGDKYFYLDWELNLWRCHHWNSPIGNILELDDIPRTQDGCQRCMIDCMRDPSVLQHVAIAVRDAVGHAKAGNLTQAARSLFTQETLTSMRAVADQAQWIARL